MKTLLIAADFSESAMHAAEYAAQFSRQIKADHLILYHAYQLLPGLDNSPMEAPMPKARAREYNEDFLRQLREKLTALVRPETLILTRTEASELGKGVSDIASICDGSGLLVIGSSRARIKNPPVAWKESETSKLIKTSSLPVLIVPKSALYRPISKIVLACDFEDVTDTLPFARLRLLIKELEAKLSVVHVNRPLQKQERIRESIIVNDLFEDLDPSTTYLKDRDVSTGILNHAAGIGAQLIVAVAKNHAPIKQLLHKSIVKELALKSDIPLLVIRRR
ncbi:universal stress protein [Parapedobacter sp. ISTM3]|uniref:universal stress protein n=1 Tax=Parapedobacter sp. ISTM3 TaxID=2800130 RepID=UPI0019032BCC|nr:universal stress protein [Parapedobacter sp. ISTM3]MBK1439922.1 universal stress protein [Parapedobacter sp. ISTM3]